MSVSSINNPNLRFPGYESDWEEKPLYDCFEERNEQFPESTEYPLMAFVADKGVTPKGEKYDRSALVKDAVTKKYKRTEFGDFIYSSNNLEAGSIGFNKYGKASISPVYSVFKAKGNIDPVFIGTLLTQKSFISELIKFRQGVVYGQWKIPEKEFLRMKIFLPCPTEQKDIAKCLSELDNLISAQEQKVEALKECKQGLMQQLFPRSGETTPRLRFPGFTGEWKEKKMSDVFSRITRKNAENNLNVLTISAQYGLISQLEFFKKSVAASDVTGYYLLKKGEFAYNKSSSQGRPFGAIKPLRLYDKGVVSTLYICFKCNDPREIDFWDQYFDAGLLDKELMSIAQEGARNHGLLNIPTSGFFNLSVFSPSIDEQQEIALCLSALDDTIQVETDKLEALKDHKKGLMQQLFPQPTK